MKKFITLVLIIIICCSISACGAPVSSPIEDFTYEILDGEAIITGYTGNDLEIVIPTTIEDTPVKKIGEKAFRDYDMTSIVIPEGITKIYGNAFYRDAFYGCKNLEKISLPDSFQNFYYENNGEEIVCNYPEDVLSDTKWYEQQPDGLLYIDNVLIGYKSTDTQNISTSIVIKDGTKSIIGNALPSNCTTVAIPESVEYIGEQDSNIAFIGKSGSSAERFALKYGNEFIPE